MGVEVLTVLFDRWTDLAAQQAHLKRGALFVPAPEPLPKPYDELTVLVVAPDDRWVELHAQVVQIAPGVGVALAGRDPGELGRTLAPLLAAARDQADPPTAAGTMVHWGRPPWTEAGAPDEAGPGGEPPDEVETRQEGEPPDEVETAHEGEVPGEVEAPHEGEAPHETAEADATDPEPLGAPVGGGDESSALEAAAGSATMLEQIRAMSSSEKLRLAIHGDRTARLLLLKDPNKTIQLHILQNKRITLEEVQHIAGNRQANPEALSRIGENREWLGHPGVVLALVSNPKTPSRTSMRLLRSLPQSEIRRLAKSPNVPQGIAQAARRLVVSG